VAAGFVVFAATLCRSGPTCPTGAYAHFGPHPHPRKQRWLICRYAFPGPSDNTRQRVEQIKLSSFSQIHPFERSLVRTVKRRGRQRQHWL